MPLEGMTLNSGCGGDTLATDKISCLQYQVVKPAFGADGCATLVDPCNGLPVDIKNATIAVTDNCGTLTVDGCVGVTGTVAVTDNCASLTVDNCNLCTIANAIHQEDFKHCHTDHGVQALAVRKDCLATLVSSDLDYTPLLVNASGALYIQEGSALDVSAAAVPVTDNCGTLSVDGCVGITGTANVCVQNAVLSVDDNCGALTVDHTNLCNLHSADFDTGAGTDTTPAIGIALPGCGGAVVGGTCGNPIRTDPTGTTTQPVSDACGSLTVDGCVGITGVVSVDDNCASLTVDNAHLTSLGGAICGTEVQVDVVGAIPAGSNCIGTVGLAGQCSGGLCVFSSIDLDETAEQVKGSGGRLYSIVAMNTTCAIIYLKVFNAPSACVTVGGACGTTPAETFPLPAHACSKGAGMVFACPTGGKYCSGITLAATTGVAVCNNGAPGCNAVIVNVRYN